MQRCEYYFGVTKTKLDKLCAVEFINYLNYDAFYDIRIKLLDKELRKELDTNGVTSKRATDLYMHLQKWKQIKNEENSDG